MQVNGAFINASISATQWLWDAFSNIQKHNTGLWAICKRFCFSYTANRKGIMEQNLYDGRLPYYDVSEIKISGFSGLFVDSIQTYFIYFLKMPTI